MLWAQREGIQLSTTTKLPEQMPPFWSQSFAIFETKLSGPAAKLPCYDKKLLIILVSKRKGRVNAVLSPYQFLLIDHVVCGDTFALFNSRISKQMTQEFSLFCFNWVRGRGPN